MNSVDGRRVLHHRHSVVLPHDAVLGHSVLDEGSVLGHHGVSLVEGEPFLNDAFLDDWSLDFIGVRLVGGVGEVTPEAMALNDGRIVFGGPHDLGLDADGSGKRRGDCH